ncbi:MAG: hypothetical protein IKZ07_03970 [Akkermansia sp.]|nr:hypothetical protein [Akkermansia sp.]
MRESAGIRKVMVVVLVALFLAQLGGGLYDVLFSNYLNDVLHLDAGARGFMELPRELPGVLSWFVMAALFFLNEIRLAAVSILLAVVGTLMMMLLGEGATLWQLSLTVATASLGLHILMGIVDSIVMHTARPENRSLRLGQMRAMGTAASLIGALFIWLKWKFNQDFMWDYILVTGIFLISSLMLFFVKSPEFPRRKSVKENFILRREYALYYGIETLHGIRKQLYMTFGFWLLVNTLQQPPGRIGMIVLIAGIIGLFAQPFIGMCIKRYGERRITIIDSIALSVLCLVYAFALEMLPGEWAVVAVACCFVLDKVLFAMGMARTTYIARICGERRSDITPCIYTGIAINHVASIAYGIIGGLIWTYTGGPQLVFLTGGLAVVGAGILARKMK